MCGISCCVMKKGQVDTERFEKMTDIIAHRGPDDRGTYYDDKLAIGHRRLSILDLSDEGHQPFIYKNRYILSYNGEIYNYIELRNDLQKKGYTFHSQSDTEVLVAMYDCYGEECVNYFNGMWSFVLYDKLEKRLFCSRDRYGVKPFYYFYNQDCFFAASEIKQIFVMLKNKPVANRKRLLEFIVLGDQDYSEDTMFQGIKQLRGGHSIIFDIEKYDYHISRYFNLGRVNESKTSYEDACLEFEQAFRNSIDLRLRADVPVGYCLSGGLDSSSIVCMADDILKKRKTILQQHVISSCFEDKQYDEQEYIDEVVAHTNVESHKIFPNEEQLFEKIDKIIWHMDEPFGSTSIYAQWNVFEEAKRHGLTVMLDGQGADEQLAGYSTFYSVLFTYYLKKMKLGKFRHEVNRYINLRADSEKYVPYKKIVLKSIVSAVMPEGLKAVLLRNRKYCSSSFPFSKEVIDQMFDGRRMYPIRKDRQFILDSMQYGMSALLHYEDRDSMAHSIESRVPFLDCHLTELIFSYPITYKIRNGITKAVQRDGLTHILPDKIRNRYSKLGFVTPEDQWINQNYEVYRQELETASKQLEPLIDAELIMRWFDAKKGRMERGEFLPWRIICAGHWIKVFDVSI